MVALRPEATASVVRAYIEHGMHDAAREPEALLRGADVPPRAAAEGALPAVLPDWRGGAWPVGCARDRRRSDRDAAGAFQPRGAHAHDALRQFDRLQGLPAEICRAAARGTAQSERPARRGQPAPHRDESAARARFKVAARSRRSSQRCRASRIISATRAASISPS